MPICILTILLCEKNNYGVIDFDDCGVGLYGYDLGVALFAFHQLTDLERDKDFQALKEAVLQGYADNMPFTQVDLNMIPYFLLARKLSVVGWLEIEKKTLD